MVIAGSQEGITMIEAGAREVQESEVAEVMRLGYQEIAKIIKAQQEIIAQVGEKQREVMIPPLFEDLPSWLEDNYRLPIREGSPFGETEREKEVKLLLQKLKNRRDREV